MVNEVRYDNRIGTVHALTFAETTSMVVPDTISIVGWDPFKELAAKDAEIERLKEENKELNDLFDMRWKRDMEALAIWRAAGSDRDLSLPDRADGVVFLLDLLSARDATIRELEEAAKLPAKTEPTIEHCSYCGKPVRGSYNDLRPLDQPWHKACWYASNCGKPPPENP